MPRRPPAQARRHARRRQRRNDHRLRRFAFLALVATVSVVTAALTAFDNGRAERTAALTPVSPVRLLPAGRPEPFVIAKLNGLRIQLPVAAGRVTAIGYQGAGDGALALEPVGRQGNQGWLGRAVHRIVGGGGSGPVWYQLGGGGGPQTSGLDIGAASGTDVYSPVDGTVVGLRDYVLDGKAYGSIIDVQPTDEPSVVVSITHLRADPSLRVGSPLTSRTSRIGAILDFAGVERLALARYTQDAGNHVEIEVRPAASLETP
jgi:murein DD-endopeptidase MepM/ murein hydrolase activator NlpD